MLVAGRGHSMAEERTERPGRLVRGELGPGERPDELRGWAGGELVPVERPEELGEWAELLVSRAREDGVALTGEGGLLTDLMRHVLQTGLEVEMAEHLVTQSSGQPPPLRTDRTHQGTLA